MNKIVRVPESVRRSRACSMVRRRSATPAVTALIVSKCARVAWAITWAIEVFPVPGGPYKITDERALQVAQPFSHDPAQMNPDHPAAVLAQRLEISQRLGAPEGPEGVG